MSEGRVDAVKRSGDSIFIVKCGSESLGFRMHLFDFGGVPCDGTNGHALGQGLAHDGGALRSGGSKDGDMLAHSGSPWYDGYYREPHVGERR